VNFSKFFAGFFLGSLIVLAFQPFNYWFLTFLIPGLLYQLIKSEGIKNTFFISYFFGLGLWAIGIFWIENSISVYGGASPILGSFLTLLLAAFLSLFQAISFTIFKLVTNHRKTYEVFLLFPATWILSEWLREFLFTGFPWLYIGYTSVDNNLLQGYIPVLGIFGIGFLIVLISQIFLSLLGSLRDLTQRKSLYLSSIVLIIIFIVNQPLENINWTKSTGKISATVVQPNIDIKEKWTQKGLQKIESAIGKKLSQNPIENLTQPSVIFWPEVTLTSLIQKDRIDKFRNSFLNENNMLGMVIGALSETKSEEINNSLIGIGNISGIYDKKFLVPFGEYVPLSGLFSVFFDFFNFNRPQIFSGKNSELIGNNLIKISSAICYEIAYQNIFLSNSKETNVLFNASNDNWFGTGLGPHQHLQIARFRAAEHQKYLVRSTSTGISALINHHGQILKKIETSINESELESFQEDVILKSGQTPYAIFGKKPFLFVLVIIFFISAILKFRRDESFI
jgi:apolipoprotein N-acyltransferase